jgi:hypothetical protein
MNIVRRISYIFLCALPFLDLVIVGVRALRIPGVYQVIGGVLFAVILIAVWILGAGVFASAAAGKRRLALAGSLLIAPWAIVSLLWVGLGAPFQATITENHMRFLVLLASSIIVPIAFVALKQELYEAAERFYSTVGFAASIPAGVGYFVCVSMSVAQTMTRLGGDKAPLPVFLENLYSVLEFVAVILTYVATAAFAASLGEARWLRRGAARAYVIACMVLLLLLVMGGLSYPELSASTAPWYVRPGFIARIPAIPWIMPGLLGVVLLRRAGNEQPQEGPNQALQPTADRSDV